jgi:hypothetical protein
MRITSTAHPTRGQVSPAYTNGKKIERTALVHLEAA